MRSSRRWASVALATLAAACGRQQAAAPPAPNVALAAHGAEFRREIVSVTDGVRVAVGYGLANSILLEGTDGFVVVDTLESVEEARTVDADFRKIVGGKPLKAIIYTHNHPDHTFGAAAFVHPGETPAIYAQEKLNDALDALITEVRPVIGRRSLRMYGYWLAGDALGNQGVGPFLGLREGSTLSVLRPTRTFRDRLEDTVAGIHFELVSAPGETDDMLFVRLPEKNAILCGDDFYRAFPNLYTIRGTPYRNPRTWADSLDRIRALRPEFLVPSHSRPLTGADTIATALTDYRDAIRYVYDQTVRGMNQGLTEDEIAATLKLPERLARSPYLQEFYGKAAWSSRMVFEGNVGWFDGDPAHLQPLSPAEEAKRIEHLAGGTEGLHRQLADAVAQQDWQWVLELTDRMLLLAADDALAKDARVRALTALGEAEANAPARHYYLMSALELKDGRKLPERTAQPTPQMLAQMPLTAFFTGMSVNLDAKAAAGLDERVGFDFTDTREAYTLHVRHGVCELTPGIAGDVEVRVKVPAQVFKEMLAQLRNPAVTLAKDFTVVKGSKIRLIEFMKLFTPPAGG